MTQKKTIIIILCLIIAAILLAYLVFSTMMKNSTTLYVNPQTIKSSVDQDFTINISISHVSDLYGLEFELNWTATILSVVNVTEGPFLKSGGQTFFYDNLNATAGKVIVECTLEANVTGVNGSGVLATIRFHVIKNGECELLLYETTLLTPSLTPIGHAVKSGEFST